MLDMLQRDLTAAVPQGAPAAEIVALREVRKRFGAVAALDGVSLSVGAGEVLGIIGRSGAGKSTLIRCLNGLERPDSGEVRIEGRDITRLSERALQPVRRRIGMIFQHFNLLSAKTVAQNVALPLVIAGWPRAKREKRVAELLELVGLADKARAWPGTLSGGQKQRVGIARALAAEPVLLLSDEATSALDPETTASILELLGDINRRLGLTVVLITHEMSVVRAIADRVAVLAAGRVVEEGPLRQVFAMPATEITRRLLAELRPELPAALRARLDEAGPTALLRVAVHGAQARTPLLGELGAALACEPVLLHGGIDHVGSEPVGTLFVGVPAGRGAAAAAFLAPRVTEVEVLGHVGVV